MPQPTAAALATIAGLAAWPAQLSAADRWSPDAIVTERSMSKIDGVCLCGRNLFVTDKGKPRVFELDTSGALRRILPSRGQDPHLFKKPIGIACLGDSVVVIDELRERAIVIGLDGRVIRQVKAPAEAPFKKPEGVAAAADGGFYVVDTGAHRVTAFDRDGRFVRTFGKKGSGPGELFKPESATVDDDGRVYVADEGNHRVVVFDAAGAFVMELGGCGVGPGAFDGDVEGITIDKRGFLLALDADESLLEVFDRDGKFVTQLGDGDGDAPEQVKSADGVFYDRNRDAVWVADQGHAALKRFPIAMLARYARPGSPEELAAVRRPWTPDVIVGAPAFCKIDGVCLCGGKLFVTDKGDPSLVELEPGGRMLRTLLGPRDAAPFHKPIGLACQGDHLIVVDEKARRALLLALDGRLLAQTDGQAPSALLGPQGVGLSPDGSFVIVDTLASRVVAYDRSGRFLRAFGTEGTGMGEISRAESVTVGPDGRIYVSDEGSSRISVFAASGAFDRIVSGHGDGPGRFAADVEGLSFDRRGLLLALDEDEGVVEVFTPDGAFVAQLGNGSGDRPDQLESPDGDFYDPAADALWVADQGHSLVKRFPLSTLLFDTDAPPHRGAAAGTR
ncbi:MAG: NHL repeat-containing protein [Acidobacteriota bacterium]